MNVENNREDWLLWQISDSALPTGGFVASSGLESAIQTGYVHDIPSLSIFLSSSIDNYAFSSLPFVTGKLWNWMTCMIPVQAIMLQSVRQKLKVLQC
ncbi:21257_t:CDS:2 [Entrophospora sp. SA101]|nr:4759_t:CDS:2 [Entrophospora sp. SA101]CAJ0747614.1 4767_t:CDS:2 [Entrophospora sp. SA101]CAJ0758277.1 21257_t:CDS:2 [Entrophospora sp. SA101]